MSRARVHGEVQADVVDLADDAVIGADTVIRAGEAIVESGVRIGRGVDITCDRIHLKRGCRLADFSTILSPEVILGENCTTGRFLSAELNQHFRVGRNSSIGERVSIVGQGFESEEFLWLKNDVTIGGGGARGPDSYLTVGSRTTIIDRCFINLSEGVTIGSRTALSYNVALLTHGAWQSPLKGYFTRFGSIHIGDDVVVYLNAVVMPGVTINDGSVVGASSLVLQDVPPHCLVAGNPARVRKGPEGYPPVPDNAKTDAMVTQILCDYLTTLGPKGVRIKESHLPDRGVVALEHEDREYALKCVRTDGKPGNVEQVHVTPVSAGSAAEGVGGCHFDLCAARMTGDPNPIGEDLRDFLRRRGIRIFTERPFQSIPLANVRRLRDRREGHSDRRNTRRDLSAVPVLR